MRFVSWLALASAAGVARIVTGVRGTVTADEFVPAIGVQHLAATAAKLATPGNPCVVWGTYMPNSSFPLMQVHDIEDALIGDDWKLFIASRALKATGVAGVRRCPIDYALATVSPQTPQPKLLIVTDTQAETDYCVEAARRTKSPARVIVYAQHHYEIGSCTRHTVQYNPASATAGERAAWIAFMAKWVKIERGFNCRRACDVDPLAAAHTFAECFGCDTESACYVFQQFEHRGRRMTPEDTACELRDYLRAFATERVQRALERSSSPQIAREVLRRAADPANSQPESDSRAVRDLIAQQLITLECGIARLRWPIVATISAIYY